MLNEIDVKSNILNKQCSEYTIYQIYLQKNNLFNEHYKEKQSYRYNFKYPQQHMKDYQLKKLLKIVKANNIKICTIQTRINIHHRISCH